MPVACCILARFTLSQPWEVATITLSIAQMRKRRLGAVKRPQRHTAASSHKAEIPGYCKASACLSFVCLFPT